jgi:wyosine [tRNA(Phe)-imidazoG37] synthetase (radical SAM superfamily)
MYTFGPVPSRRLGRSLGIDVVPMKTCTLSCRYCQIGLTPCTTLERREYVPADAVVREVEKAIARGPRPDWLTFSGSGEPTLNSALGGMIRRVKKLADIPVCVITNGTLMSDPAVRHDLLEADAVMPSLDAAREDAFRRVCRPHRDLRVATIIDGLTAFRREYHGLIWLEILFVRGLNDSSSDIDALLEAVALIQPDAIHMNTVVRPPAESDARPVDAEWLDAVRARFGEKAIVIALVSRSGGTRNAERDGVLAYLARRPGTAVDIAGALDADPVSLDTVLKQLCHENAIAPREHDGDLYWEQVRTTVNGRPSNDSL